MAVPVVQVWPMRMDVGQSAMVVGMAVGFRRSLSRFMFMLVMFVVHMAMVMIKDFMIVLVYVLFREMKPGPKCHQQARDYQYGG
jgi:purine-cytosine permease-like protein